MDKLLLKDLKDGQKIKTLDDLYYLDVDGDDNTYDTDDCFIQLTGRQLKNFDKIATAGDIGTFCKESGSIVFSKPNTSNGLNEDEYIFLDQSDEGKIDLELFELVEDE